MIVELARAQPEGRTADVGTGSGCLAVTLALERPGRPVAAVDLSEDALAVARTNAARHGARVALLRADALEAFLPRSLDLVVANPPYVDPRERDDLPVEVRDHEPALALFSPGGTTHLERWLAAAVRALAPGGRLLFEIGFGQEATARAFAGAHPELRDVRLHRDFREIPRILDARVDSGG